MPETEAGGRTYKIWRGWGLKGCLLDVSLQVMCNNKFTDHNGLMKCTLSDSNNHRCLLKWMFALEKRGPLRLR